MEACKLDIYWQATLMDVALYSIIYKLCNPNFKYVIIKWFIQLTRKTCVSKLVAITQFDLVFYHRSIYSCSFTESMSSVQSILKCWYTSSMLSSTPSGNVTLHPIHVNLLKF